jgi:hypothetical protein
VARISPAVARASRKVVAVASARVVMVATDSATTKAYILFHNEIPATTGIFFMLKI